MELRQLRYLVALADELHFTRAAARANVAQPALSRQIRSLERELGVPLVDRTSRRVALSPAGARLVERARRILEEVEAARSDASDLRRLVTGRVTLGVSTTPGPVDVPALLAGFHRAHPGVELAVRDGLTLELARQLRDDVLDVAFLTTGSEHHGGRLATVLVAEEPLAVCVGADHRLAGQERVSLGALASERFAVFGEGATIRTQIERAAAAAGFAPKVGFELGDIGRMRALVAQGLAIAVLPRSQAGTAAQDTMAVGLADPDLVLRIFLAWRRDRELSPAAQAFLSSARSHRAG